MELHYAAAAESDISFIAETYHENMASLHGVPRTADDWKKLMAEGRAGGSRYYIVRAQTPVAWFRTDVEDGVFWLGMLQVKPAYQRRGIGRYVLSVVEEIAKQNGFRKIGIHTTQDNAAARALYVSAGFTVTEIGPCTTADGAQRTGFTFEKQTG